MDEPRRLMREEIDDPPAAHSDAPSQAEPIQLADGAG
jgi:hypothetical protein